MAVYSSKNIFSLDSDSLVKVPDVKVFIDSNNLSICEFYNQGGGLVLGEGKKVSETVMKMPICVKKSIYEKHLGPLSSQIEIGETQTSSEEIKTPALSKIERDAAVIKETEVVYGKKNVEMTMQAIDGLKDIMSVTKLSKSTLVDAQDIVEETFKLERESLVGCISALRSIDTYTYDHSFGVYLLFSQALEDFRKYMDRPIFYDVFKTLNSNVNFNSNSIKKYATAALLHDFGKRSIPSDILLKESKLTQEEFEIIKYHPRIAVKEFYDLGIDDVAFLEIVGNHHRNYLTFPKKGQSPLAQICNIVDIYEACRSKRSYKLEQSFNQVQGILLDEKQKKTAHNWDSFIFVTIMKDTLPKFEAKRAK